MLNKKILLGAAMGIMLGLASFETASAVDIDVDASINTTQAISLTKNTDMVFGDVEFQSTHAGDIQLGTNGAVALSGATGLVMSGTPSAGSVSVTGASNGNIQISCDTGGTLSDGNSNTLTLSGVEFTTGAGGTPGTGTACAGVGTSPAAATLDASGAATVLMGGTINVNGNAIASSAAYSTASAGGDPVTLQVVYQ